MHELSLANIATTLARSVRLCSLVTIVGALAVAGCSASDGLPYDDGASAQQQTGGGNVSATGGAGTGGIGTPTGTNGGSNFSSTGGNSGGVSGSAEWCAVEAILEEECQSCHNEKLSFGAPMPLVTHADMTAPAPSDGSRPVYEVAMERVTATAEPMPPPPNSLLSEGDIATLQAWVDAGTPTGSCDVSTNGGVTNGGTTSNGFTTDGGTTSNGGGASGGTSGSNNAGYPPDCIDCGDYACTEGTPIAFRAHQNPVPGDTEPFDASDVGANGNPNSYECFYFEAPWSAATQLIGHRPIIDNERVLHHWLLYASNTPPLDLQDGGRRSACQFQPDANRVLLAGWAPGTPGGNLPSNVGQALPDGDRVFVTLEVHYFNTNPGQEALDRSGVEVCLTDTPRQHEAAMHWLGTEDINIPPNAEATAGDTCTPNQGETATILRLWPHMHLTGTRAKLDLIRSSGARETLHDRPFSFDNQTVYPLDTPVQVNPGDRLEATCTYQNPNNHSIFFGEGSDEEMCYIFALAYPAGSLHNGKNGCLPGVGCVPGGVRRCIDNENILTAIGGL